MYLVVTAVVGLGSLATDALLDSIRNAFKTGPQSTETVGFLVGLLAFVVLIVVAWRVFSRERSAADEPQTDYLTLAVDLLGLSESDRRDLQKIAHRAGLDQPSAMLLSPANLARAASPALLEEHDRELRERLGGLCQRLFDTPLPDPRALPDQPPRPGQPGPDVKV